MSTIKNTLSKGLTTINVKTNSFMEQNKIKTYISTLENEIVSLKTAIGEKIYTSWINGGIDTTMIASELSAIRAKEEMIMEQRRRLQQIENEEKQILGNNNMNPNPGFVFCGACGSKNNAGSNFCIKCGNKL